jgi:G1/S-specific cyclin-E1
MPNLSWANSAALWNVMRRKDSKYQHDSAYLSRHIGIEPQMRAILLDWLVEISYAYRLHRETWHLACEYMDRFMSTVKQQMRVDRLQLIGMTSLFLAAKVEEIYPPKLKDLAGHMENYSNNNEDAISQFELFMLKTLNWEISPVSANTWLTTYLQIITINLYLTNDKENRTHGAHFVMPFAINTTSAPASLISMRNSSANSSTANIPDQQKDFYVTNYMKAVTLLDLCMFDIDSLKFTYSILAASALYHMLTPPKEHYQQQQDWYHNDMNKFIQTVIQKSTGNFFLNETFFFNFSFKYY